MITSVASALFWAFNARRAGGTSLNALRRFPKMPDELRRRRMGELLHERIRYFGSRADALPEWREAAKLPDGEALLRVWTQLPIVTKDTLRDQFPPERIAALGVRGRPGSTGGSTGEPTRFLHDEAMLWSGEAKAYYTRRRLGWKPGMTTVCVWGSDADIGKKDPPTKKLVLALRKERLVSGYNLDEGTVRSLLRFIEREAPVCVYGFTSMLAFVARTAKGMGLSAARGSVRAAWNGGEMLTNDQSELFASVFGVPISNLYGGRELSTIACQFRREGPLEVLRPLVFAEVVDEAGRPAAPGEPGRLILTSTVCGGTPFLRYAIGDIAIADPSSMDAAGLGALKEIQGRSSGVLTLPNGMTINNIFWNHLFKEYGEIHQFQVRIGERGLRVLLRGAGLGAERDAELRRRLEGFLRGLPFELTWVPSIELTARGKLVQVVDERRA